MIENYEKFRISDLNKEKDFFIEVNYKDDPETNQCKILKITFPNKDVAYIKRDELMAFLFAIGRPEDQRKMIPQRIRRTRWYETVIGVKATKDIRKGEMMNFPIKISLPDVSEEVIGEIKKDYIIEKKPKSLPNLILPK